MSHAMSIDPTPVRAAAERDARLPASVRRGLMAAAVAAGLAAGFLAQDGAAATHAASVSGADLTRLLRAMAVIKACMAFAAAWAVWWRLAVPAAPLLLAGYAASGAAMAAGPVLIWQMVHVAAGAALLHGGLIAAVLLLWRDPATGALLASLVAARRLTRRQVS